MYAPSGTCVCINPIGGDGPRQPLSRGPRNRVTPWRHNGGNYPRDTHRTYVYTLPYVALVGQIIADEKLSQRHWMTFVQGLQVATSCALLCFLQNEIFASLCPRSCSGGGHTCLELPPSLPICVPPAPCYPKILSPVYKHHKALKLPLQLCTVATFDKLHLFSKRQCIFDVHWKMSQNETNYWLVWISYDSFLIKIYWIQTKRDCYWQKQCSNFQVC